MIKRLRRIKIHFDQHPVQFVASVLLPAVLLLPHVPLASKLLAPSDLYAASAHKLAHVTADYLASEHFDGFVQLCNMPHSASVGGTSLLLIQAGYSALAAALTVAIALIPRLAKPALSLFAKALILTNVVFMVTATLHDRLLLGTLSLLCSLLLAAGFAFVCKRVPQYAGVLLIAMCLQSAVSAYDSLRWLFNPNSTPAIVATAHAVYGHRLWSPHAGLTHMGYLACAVDISHILRDTGIASIDELSVKGLENKLLSLGWKHLTFEQRQPGDVIVAYGPKDQHVGIVSETPDLTYDNHSSDGRWLQDPASYWTTKLRNVDLFVLRAPKTGTTTAAHN